MALIKDKDIPLTGIPSKPRVLGILPSPPPSVQETSDHDHPEKTRKSWQFVLALVSLCLIAFASSFDGSTINVALPRITHELNAADKYIWIANCFVLSQTVIQPPLAQLCNIFGRRSPVIAAVAIFALGSGIAGGSTTAGGLIAGRTIQGLGSGGILLLCELIICDMVPLRERGKYVGIVLSSIAVGSMVGPVVGGALVQVNWRWIFYLNLPISGVVLVVMIFCLPLRYTKEPTWGRALSRIDWTGNFIFIGSICAFLLGLVFGGEVFPWSSWRVILPIVIGAFGWAGFHLYEHSCKEPIVPSRLFGNRTSVAGFFMIFLSSMLVQWVNFFWPLYFLAVRGTSPLRAGINTLPYLAFLILGASVAGVLLTKFGVYHPMHLVGFCLSLIGPGLNLLLSESTSTAEWVVFQMVDAIGRALLFPTLLPAILASLAESDVATATGMYSFLRSFGFVWGFTIPGIIFNTAFDHNSPQISDVAVRKALANGHAYELATGPFINSLSPSLHEEVVGVYVKALKAVWEGAIAFGVLGLFAVFVEKHVPLRTELETQYGLQEKKAPEDREKGNCNMNAETTVEQRKESS
ncbi:MFS general substrate transporter [Glonium stellatum]|uniref:MFS general substrate transporter n=1 Tax=Glonium stellatum TaxID=574774 RepID=A0A8E2ENW3_9PEZI|nr:MFS general substrate transporter [Glonium stellatum]